MNEWRVKQTQWYTSAPKHLQIAQTQVGIEEATGKNDGRPSKRYMGGRKEPWCGHFVAYCFRQAGTPLPGDVEPSVDTANPLAGVQYMEDMFKQQGWWFAAGDPRHRPEPGDVIFYKSRHGSDPGRGRHVGIVELVDAGVLSTIEGNWGNGVSRRRLIMSNTTISGFGRYH